MSHDALSTASTFENILDDIERLTREHVLFYRVQVGRLLLQRFWDGDGSLFSRRDLNKEMRFDLFFNKCGEELQRYGLSKRKARESVRAAIVAESLPVALVARLFLSQLLELTRLTDPTERVRVAQAALAQDWSVLQLRDAVTAVRAGLPLDGDAETPGMQVPKVVVTEPKPVPGRMVTRAEKLAASVETWATRWEQVDAGKLRPVQRRRLAAAVDALEAQVVRLRAGLSGEGGSQRD